MLNASTEVQEFLPNRVFEDRIRQIGTYRYLFGTVKGSVNTAVAKEFQQKFYESYLEEIVIERHTEIQGFTESRSVAAM